MSIDDLVNRSADPVSLMAKAILGQPEEIRPVALYRLSTDDNPDTRARCLLVARRIGFSDTAAICIRLLRDPVAYVRMRACEHASDADLAEVAPNLIEMLSTDDDEGVLAAAAVSAGFLCRMKDIEQLNLLLPLVSGNNHEGTPVRHLLLFAIERIQSRNK